MTSTRPRGQLRELRDGRREAELLERHDLVRDRPEDGADGVALQEHVHAEAALARDRVRRVELVLGLELLPLLLGEDGVDHPPDLRAVQLRELGEALELAVDADRRVDADREVEVGAVEVEHVAGAGR